MSKKQITTLAFALCFMGGALSAALPLSVGTSLASSGVKVLSKGLTSTLESTSGSSDSSSGSSGRVAFLDLKKLGQPSLVKSYRSNAPVALKFPQSIHSAEQLFLEEVLEQNKDFIAQLGVKNLIVKIQDLPSLKRRGEGARFKGNTLYLNQEALKNHDAQEVELAILRGVWSNMSELDQGTWAMLSGWSRLPLFPLIRTHKKVLSSDFVSRSHSPMEDFCQSMIRKKEGQELTASKKAFIEQSNGKHSLKPEVDLKNIDIYFSYIEEKGIAGSSQGHCAVMIDDGKNKISLAYIADFNWDRPIRSAMSALVGTSQRNLEVLPYTEFFKSYQKEERKVHLIKMNLKTADKHRLLYRLAECVDTEKGQYSFLRQNCSNPLRDVFQYSIPDERKNLSKWFTPRSLRNWALRLDSRV